MGLLSRIADMFGGGARNAISLPEFSQDSQAWSDMFGPTKLLPQPTETTAFSVSAIYASVNLIAGAVSAMPLNIYRRDMVTGERTLLHNDSLSWVFNEEMVPRWSAASGWEFLVQSLLIHGDAFAIIKRDGAGTPNGIEPVHPYRVTVAVLPDASRLVYRIFPENIAGQQIGESRTYDQDDILHVAGFGFNGFRGLSPLRHSLRMAGAVAISTQDYSANFFANSARPDYALKTDQVLSPEKIIELRAMIDEQHRGTDNAHRPMLLQGGLDIKPWSIPLAEMQLLETRRFQIEEIARIYGVPAFMIGAADKTSSWGTGTETLGKVFVRYALRQHLNKFQTEINRKMFRTASRICEFDVSDLERADSVQQMESLRIGLGRAGEPAFLTKNEARAVLRLKHVPDGDKLETNLAPVAAPNKDKQDTTAK